MTILVRSGQNNDRLQWVIFLVVAAWLLLFYDRGFNHPDEGNGLYPAIRILNGELPHLDFDTLYTGGIYYFYALLFKVFGIHIGIIRIALACVLGLTAVITTQIGARLVNGPWRFIPALILLFAFPINPTAFHSWYAIFFGTTALWLLLRYLDQGDLGYLLAAGLSAGLGFLSKQTMGAFSLAGLLVCVTILFPLTGGMLKSRPDRVFRSACLVVVAVGFTVFIRPAWTLQPHFGVMFLGPVWLLPLLVWNRGADDRADSWGVYHRLGGVILTFMAPLLLYAAYFA